MYVKFGKQWINCDSITTVTKAGSQSLNVRTADNSKFGLAGDEAHEFLKLVKIDAKEFFAEPAPAPAPAPVVVPAQPDSEPEPEDESEEE